MASFPLASPAHTLSWSAIKQRTLDWTSTLNELDTWRDDMPTFNIYIIPSSEPNHNHWLPSGMGGVKSLVHCFSSLAGGCGNIYGDVVVCTFKWDVGGAEQERRSRGVSDGRSFETGSAEVGGLYGKKESSISAGLSEEGELPSLPWSSTSVGTKWIHNIKKWTDS